MEPVGDAVAHRTTGGFEADRPEVPPTPAEVEGLVRALVGMMRGGVISELDLAFGSVSVRLRGAHQPPATATVAAAPAALSGAAPEATEDHHFITAPMIGTFYAAPSPSDPPFVEIGDPVEVGQTVGIIEAMKIMNEIAADRAGLVAALLVASGQPVEYGSPLIRLAPTAGDAA